MKIDRILIAQEAKSMNTKAITRQHISTSFSEEEIFPDSPLTLFKIEKKRNASFSFEMQEASLNALNEATREEKLLVETGALSSMPAFVPPVDTSTSLGAVSTIEMAPGLVDLVEKCVQAMVHIDKAGISETTFYLDTPQFSGAKIVITEFNTAPKAFNIALVGTPEVVALFNLHAKDLLACFQKSSFNFTVHRLESDIDLHLVKKVDETSDQEEEEEKQ